MKKQVGIGIGILAMLLSSWVPLSAEEEKIEEIETAEVEEVTQTLVDSENFPLVTRWINLQSGRTLRKKSVLFVIDHRNHETFLDNTFDDFLGFDAGGIKVGLGLRYGILDRLDAGLYRLNGQSEIFDVYEFDGKYHLLRRDKVPLDLALRGGFTWFVQDHEDDAVGYFGQVLASRTFADRYTVGSGLLFHSDSTNDVKSTEDDDYSLAIPASLEVRFAPNYALDLEGTASVAGYGAAHPCFTTAFKFITHRHTFGIVISNTQYTSADGVVANTWRGMDDIIFGFSITRELRSKKGEKK